MWLGTRESTALDAGLSEHRLPEPLGLCISRDGTACGGVPVRPLPARAGMFKLSGGG